MDILVNLHLAMEIIQWNWVFYAVIWGSIAATSICVMILNAIPMFVGYWYVLFSSTGERSFWVCLLGIIIAALLPRLDGIQIAREAEKFGHLWDIAVEVEMNPIMKPPTWR
ncbi:phospholipid-transporting ATPase 1-like [Populus alba x Populus x berolinensis]|uniref:Phospholipid-transporting ATPase 1-like n=1 Tax=Populus alba x Populus x berolinensis TaxID=444605 RepID=A0AAD6MPA7_9ROSI|nr:phospholipid-transporting ATPase 1-like [Populus alba x Populus x berolinensis]